MPTDKKPDEAASQTPSKQTVLLLIGTLVDTTWRLFVPTILGLMLGLWADRQYDTLPWLTALGTIVGAVLAIWLVRRQIKSIEDKG